MRFIKLFEKITEWEWYDDVPTYRVFTHLLLTANWKDTKWHGIKIGRGQRVISFRGLAEETSLTEQQVRTAIAHLKSTHEITQQSTHRYTIITVENYETYQHCEKTTNTVANTPCNTASTSDIELYRTIEDIKNIPTVYKKASATKSDAEEVVAMYNEECVSLPKVVSISAERVKKVKTRLSKHTKDELRFAFQKAEASDFCTNRNGKSETQWCNFDWIMRSETNLLKLLEGNYDNKNNADVKAVKDMREITKGMTREEYEDFERKFR